MVLSSIRARLCFVICVCSGLISPIAARADMVIDNWSTSQSLTLASGAQGTNTVGGAGVVGGQRDVELRRGGTETVTFNAGGGQAVMTSSGGVDWLSSRMFITWDGALVGLNPNPNLLADGSTKFTIGGITNTINLNVTLQVTGPGPGNATAATVALAPNNTPTDLVIPFSSFTNFATVFTQVEAMQLTITPQDNAPFTFTMGSFVTGDITAVPEPTSLALTSLAFAAVMGWRRGRKVQDQKV